MAISNVALTDTFDTQRIRLNQDLTRGNEHEITLPAAFGQANTAYARANTAYTHANAAYAQANTGTGIAVGSFNYANTLNITITSAYAQANTSYTHANNAYGQANIATTTAISSYAQSNAQTITIASAYALANSVNNSTQTLTDAASVAWDVNLGKVATLNLTSGVGVTRNIANPTNTRGGEIYVLHIIQGDSTARSIQAWGSSFKWTSAIAPPSSSGSGTRDIYSFISDGTFLYGSFIPDVR